MRLYELKYEGYGATNPDPVVKVKQVSPFSPFVKGEKKSLKIFMLRILFYLQSKGDFRIYYVADAPSGRVIHTSYVTGPGSKFPFMEKGDLHIGPCFTDPAYRGQGIYRTVLRSIHGENCTRYNRVYMIVHEDNHPSIKGIEAAGLVCVGTVDRQGIRKIYRRVSDV